MKVVGNKAELIRLSNIVFNRLEVALIGVRAGPAIYAMLSWVMTIRKRVPMTVKQVHQIIDALDVSLEEVEKKERN